MYHRIADHVPDPLLQCVPREIFWEQVREIKRRYALIGLGELRDGLRRNRLPRGAVMLTFDDGYADHLSAAAVLTDHGAPGAFFIISGRIGAREPLLHDELAGLVLTGEVPHELTVTTGAGRRTWQLNGCPPQSEPWNTESPAEPNVRQACFRDLHQITRPMPDDARAVVLAQLRTSLRRDPAFEASHRVLNHGELRELAAIDRIEVGCHTETHLMLARQPLAVQRREIFASKSALEALLGKPVMAFAYPYGGPEAVSSETAGLVREAGFDLSFDAVHGLVRPGCDRFTLPRYAVRNWPLREFSSTLKAWING
jgi:peptidoglycan/xylan/chitin deacetylase (PgdA/CDA1 family)